MAVRLRVAGWADIMAHLAEPSKAALACGRKRHAKTGRTDSRHLEHERASVKA
jgi:hypothetical protein